jgi:hypothetical protein
VKQTLKAVSMKDFNGSMEAVRLRPIPATNSQSKLARNSSQLRHGSIGVLYRDVRKVQLSDVGATEIG